MKAFSLLGWFCWVVLATPLARTEIVVGAWTPIFQGIDYATGSADAREPRLQQVRVVRVDMRNPNVEFFTTPANGDAPLETTSETASEFLAHHRLQVAINANFFAPCCEPGEKDLTGLAISRGEIVSRPMATGAAGTQALAITRDNRARIASTAQGFSTAGIWTAIAGSDWVLVHGEIAKQPATEFRAAAHPRTAVGLSRDGRYLFLMTIDGRQPGWSDGATTEELAAWLQRFGAYDGLNLDGGGSTALVREQDGRPVILNRPSGVALGSGDDGTTLGLQRVERSNGNNFGVLAPRLNEIVIPGMPRR